MRGSDQRSTTYTQQPGATASSQAEPTWMDRPPSYDECPPGLEYLGLIDHIQVHQKMELLEFFTQFEMANKYVINNGLGQQVYFAFEESDFCMRQMCGGQRAFTIHIVDNFNQEVMRVNRPFKCCSGCCCCADPDNCCSSELTIEAPPGNLIGIVQQRTACCSYAFVVLDSDGTEVLEIDGPCCCTLSSCSDKVFEVNSLDGQKIGEVRKKWGGCMLESFTDADNFGVSFPMDLSIRTKASLIGATFLIDFMAFERKQGKNSIIAQDFVWRGQFGAAGQPLIDPRTTMQAYRMPMEAPRPSYSTPRYSNLPPHQGATYSNQPDAQGYSSQPPGTQSSSYSIPTVAQGISYSSPPPDYPEAGPPTYEQAVKSDQ